MRINLVIIHHPRKPMVLKKGYLFKFQSDSIFFGYGNIWILSMYLMQVKGLRLGKGVKAHNIFIIHMCILCSYLMQIEGLRLIKRGMWGRPCSTRISGCNLPWQKKSIASGMEVKPKGAHENQKKLNFITWYMNEHHHTYIQKTHSN
jgi:hypothetical protein